MKVINIPEQNEVHILGCKEKLQFKVIDKVAKAEGLGDYAIEEAQILTGSRPRVIKGYSYKLKYRAVDKNICRKY